MRTVYDVSLVVLFGLILVAFGGCAKISSPENGGRVLSLPKSRMTADSVALEVAIMQLDNEQNDEFEDFFRETDSLKFPLQVRRQLDVNGFRVSVMGSQSSTAFDKLLIPRPIDIDSLNEFKRELYDRGMMKPESRIKFHQRVENQDGEAHPISVSEVYPQISWRLNRLDQREVDQNNRRHGRLRTMRNAKGVMRVTTFPLTDGTVRVLFTPEIHFGSARSRIGIADKNFAYEDRQSVMPIEQLKFDVVIRTGEAVVVAPTAELGDLGAIFFGNVNDQAIVSGEDSKNSNATKVEMAADSEEEALVFDSEETETFFPMLKNVEVAASDESKTAIASIGNEDPRLSKSKALPTDLNSPLSILDQLTTDIQKAQQMLNDGPTEADLAMQRLEAELNAKQPGLLNDLDAFANELAEGAGFVDAQDRERDLQGATNPDAPQSRHRFLMVRLVQTQMDDLFNAGDLREKLSTAIVE